jgi:hypothetical protein
VIVVPHAPDVVRQRQARLVACLRQVFRLNDVHKGRDLDSTCIASRAFRPGADFGYPIVEPRSRPVSRKPSVCELANLSETPGCERAI